MLRVASLALICALPLATGILAQHEHHGDEDSVGWVPREILERPVSLREGIGKISDMVTTFSPDAQAFYNQGLAYLHSYVWIEAARSCNQALRSDPKLALAYICLSRAYSGLEDQVAAQKALENAQSLVTTLPDREQVRISLRAMQLVAINDVLNSSKHQAYKTAIDAALAKYPDDPELWLLRGNAEESTAAGRGQRGLVGAVAYYQAALAISPDNPAAEHYLVHAYESIEHPEEALKHGEIYARLCPSIPHAQHMYGHDLRVLGRSDEAIALFQKADALELSYYESEKIPARYDWHRIHNLDLMAGSYEFKGQVKQAEKLLREFFSLRANDGLWASYQGDWPRFLLSRGRYVEALTAAEEMTRGEFPLQRSMGHLFAGRALVALNRADEAQQALARAEKESENVPESDPEPLMPQPRRMLDVQRNILRGEITLRKGNATEANAQLREVLNRFLGAKGGADAVSHLFSMLYIAQQARSADDWYLAEAAAKQMLFVDPSYAGAHYVAAFVAEHKADSVTARRELTTAERLWGQADPELSEIIEVREKLAAMR